jgi:hypothetical protein
MIGMDKSDCFHHLIDRVLIRINGWKEKLLSMGGKEILIKAIAQAIPVFAMMVFKIPKTFAREYLTLSLNSGGVMRKSKDICTRRHGGRCAYQRKGVVWVFGIFIPLIWQC